MFVALFLSRTAAAEVDMQDRVPVGQNDMHGYTVAYEREEIQFPVYVVGLIGVVLATLGIVHGISVLFALALITLGYAYYNFPLLETGRPRIGASQYGIFAEGLGIIAWRSIKQLDLVSLNLRGAEVNELHIILDEPLNRALLADWRKRPYYRFLMRLPWAMPAPNHIRIPLEVFDRPADEIMRNFTRMMGFFRR
jgi:hypothetical protein